VDRSSATYHSVTVDDFTVVITEFKPKAKKEKKAKAQDEDSSRDQFYKPLFWPKRFRAIFILCSMTNKY
jgi:hypothetical protein